MDEIIERIKNMISCDILIANGKDRKVKDKDVANLLGITAQMLATAKHRGKILRDEIDDFCVKNGHSFDWVVHGRDPESLVRKTNMYILGKHFLLN